MSPRAISIDELYPEDRHRVLEQNRAVQSAVRKRLALTEKETQHAVTQLLALHGVAVYDTSQPFRAAITPGVPDLICFCDRRGLFFVEVKAEGGKQSEAQRVFQARCAVATIPYVLGGVDQVLAFLQETSR